ncbi:hypothetical protein CER06_00165, partial [Cutibacterium acnes]
MVEAATTKRRRVVGSLVAAAVVAAVPALAAGGPKPADYATQASKAADYIDSHSADLTKGDLGP